MKWYSARLVFRISCREKNHTPQFEDQLILITAADPMEAFLKARLTGEKQEFDEDGILWKFIDVGQLLEMDEPKDGLRVHSRIYEMEEALNYVSLLKDNARELYERALDSSIFTS